VTREDYIRVFRDEPARVGRMVGFNDLGRLHNEWMRQMLYGHDDMTLLAHRLSYKTSCVSVVLAMYIATLPRLSCLFMRKTDTDVKEIIRQVGKILQNEQFAYAATQIMGKPLEILKCTDTEINTSYNDSPRGTSQLLGLGSGTSITGKHYDRIFTDDIVNLEDRKSRAERERVKLIYQELINVKSHGGRIINTGTPWHKEDAISTLMPNVQRYDCYHTGIMSEALIEEKRRSMAPSLFAANYELQHIASENALFTTAPKFTDKPELLRDGIAHIDAAYGGEDYTAFTCGKRVGDTLYMYGKMWQRHADTVLDYCLSEAERLMCGPVLCEDNGDKGFLAREIVEKGQPARKYHEKENKYYKISSFLRKWWDNIIWLKGTDQEYLAQIMDYTEDAEHDDAPDSASVICRYYDKKGGDAYQSPFGGVYN
jgi:hypothetical protein